MLKNRKTTQSKGTGMKHIYGRQCVHVCIFDGWFIAMSCSMLMNVVVIVRFYVCVGVALSHI